MANRTIRKLWRGLDRARLRKLRNALQSIINRDLAMTDNAVVDKTIVFYFNEPDDAALETQIQGVMDRIQTCLDAKQ